MRAASCSQLLRMLAWLSTTPFGVPSEPEVNRTTAATSPACGPPALMNAARERQRTGEAAHLVQAKPNAFAHVFQVDDAGRPPVSAASDFLQPALFDKGARWSRPRPTSRRALPGGAQIVLASGEVQHRRHAAEQLRGRRKRRAWRSRSAAGRPIALRRARCPAISLRPEDQRAEDQFLHSVSRVAGRVLEHDRTSLP